MQFLVSLINFQDSKGADDENDENDEKLRAQTRLFMVYNWDEILPSYTRVYIINQENKDPKKNNQYTGK